MPTQREQDEIDAARLREVGRRGAKWSVEESLGIIVEESANALEGLGRRLHAAEKLVRKMNTRVYEGDTESEVPSLIGEMEAVQRDMAYIQKQLKERGIAVKTRNARVWEVILSIVRPLTGGIVALIGKFVWDKYSQGH